MVPDESSKLLNLEFGRRVDLFNREEFFECHEALEEVWRVTTGARRLFLQALIHFAVAFHLYRRQNRIGAELQMGKALRKLAGFLPEFEGVDTERLYREGKLALEKITAGGSIAGFPRFHFDREARR